MPRNAKKATNIQVTEKEKLFFENYLKTYNMADSYRKAYPEAGGNPSRQAAKLMAKPHCIAYLEKRKKQIQKKTDYSRDKWFGELKTIAHANIFDYIDLETGQLRPDVPRELLANVKKITTKNYTTKDGREHTTINIELYDKLKAIELIGRHMSYLSDTPEGNKGDLNIYLGVSETLQLMKPKDSNIIDISHEETEI